MARKKGAKKAAKGKPSGPVNKNDKLQQQVNQLKAKLGQITLKNGGKGRSKALRLYDPAGRAYLRSLSNPFSKGATVPLPDLCVANSCCFQLEHEGTINVLSGGAQSGVIIWLPATGQGGSAINSILTAVGFGWYEESASSSDNAFAYGALQSSQGAQQLYQVAEACRIVSAELRVEPVAQGTGLTGTYYAWSKTRFDEQNPTSVNAVASLDSYDRVPITSGIAVRYLPVDNNDFEFGETQTITASPAFATRNWNLGFHVVTNGTLAPSVTVNWRVKVNVEVMTRSNAVLMAPSPSPVSSTMSNVMMAISKLRSVVTPEMVASAGEAAMKFAWGRRERELEL